MFKQTLIITIILSAISLTNARAAQIDSSWTLCDENGFWSDANHWDPNVVPDNNTSNTFNVTIDSTGCSWGIEIEFDKSDYIINTLDCYGDVELESLYNNSGIECNHPNGLTNYGDLLIDGVDIDANVTNNSGAKLEFEEFNLGLGGDLYNLAGGEVVIRSTMLLDDTDVINSGVINVLRGAILDSRYGLETAQVTNYNEINLHGAEIAEFHNFLNDTNGTVEGSGSIYVYQTLDNKGTIYSYSGALELKSDNSILNTGTLTNKPGSTLNINLPGVFTNNGKIIVNPDGAVNSKTNIVNNVEIELFSGTISAPSITQTQDANFAGFGTISGDVIIEPNGLISLTGPTNIIGDVNIAENATLEISDGQTLITGQTLNNGTIELIGGTVIFQGGYSGGGTIPVTAGTDRNHFDINADGTEDLKDFAEFAEDWLWQATWY